MGGHSLIPLAVERIDSRFEARDSEYADIEDNEDIERHRQAFVPIGGGGMTRRRPNVAGGSIGRKAF